MFNSVSFGSVKTDAAVEAARRAYELSWQATKRLPDVKIPLPPKFETPNIGEEAYRAAKTAYDAKVAGQILNSEG